MCLESRFPHLHGGLRCWRGSAPRERFCILSVVVRHSSLAVRAPTPLSRPASAPIHTMAACSLRLGLMAAARGTGMATAAAIGPAGFRTGGRTHTSTTQSCLVCLNPLLTPPPVAGPTRAAVAAQQLRYTSSGQALARKVLARLPCSPCNLPFNSSHDHPITPHRCLAPSWRTSATPASSSPNASSPRRSALPSASAQSPARRC